MRTNDKSGIAPRGMAFCAVVIFFVATAIGSVLPEFGNILAKELGLWAHIFNIGFLTIGIVGIGVALYLGHRRSG